MNLLRYMPHVRQMERHGLTFEDYFVSDSLCCPSRASIFTGDLPHNTGIYTNFGRNGGFQAFYERREDQRTFAVALQRAGYRTGMMGKYLNGYMSEGARIADGSRTTVPDTYVPPGWNQWDVAGFGYPEFNYRLNENGRLYRYGHRPADYLTDVLATRGASSSTPPRRPASRSSSSSRRSRRTRRMSPLHATRTSIRGSAHPARRASTRSPAGRHSGSRTIRRSHDARARSSTRCSAAGPNRSRRSTD